MRLKGAFSTLFLAGISLPAYNAASAQATVNVPVPGGTVRGTDTGSLVFRGIPYAAPPLGDLRWKAPQPVKSWKGVRNGTKNAPACPQTSEGWNQAQADFWSEDCLTLDVRTKSLDGKRPVMVWIHGGSNRAGNSGGPADSNMDAQGVVLVGVQYRLGLLGFLSHPDLSAEAGGSSGNYGLMDQIAALKWVRDNIAKFGGDPDNVTIYGESAGSQDVSLLLAAPEAQGLFHQAILQSGTPGFGMSFRSLPDAEKLGAGLGKVKDLRKLPVDQVLALQGKYGEPATDGPGMVFLRTTVDGKVLPEAPDSLIARNAPKPVIIGTDKVEFSGGPDAASLGTGPNRWYGDKAGEAIAAYEAENADPRRGSLGTRMISDEIFHCPTDRLTNLLASHGWPVWRYEFDIGENGGLTRHAYEIGFIFDRVEIGSGAHMQDYWASLAINGTPNGPTAKATSRPEWEKWNTASPRQILFTQEKTDMEAGAPRASFCTFNDNF